MPHILTRERVSYIDSNLLYAFSYSDLPLPRHLFETMTDTWEMHYFVSKFNWDDDPTIMYWIAQSKVCDKATASMIFWRSAPTFYTDFSTQEEADAASYGDVYKIVRTIITNWVTNFYVSSIISYNPIIDAPGEVRYQSPKAQWQIPDFMKSPLIGEELIVET